MGRGKNDKGRLESRPLSFPRTAFAFGRRRLRARVRNRRPAVGRAPVTGRVVRVAEVVVRGRTTERQLTQRTEALDRGAVVHGISSFCACRSSGTIATQSGGARIRRLGTRTGTTKRLVARAAPIMHQCAPMLDRSMRPEAGDG